MKFPSGNSDPGTAEFQVLAALVRLTPTPFARGRSSPEPSATASMKRASLNEADEIADGFDSINDAVREFDAKLIFDHYHQFETVKPVSTKIFQEVWFIRNIFNVYAQMFSDQIAELRSNVFVRGRWFLMTSLKRVAGLLRHWSTKLAQQHDLIRKFSSVASMLHSCALVCTVALTCAMFKTNACWVRQNKGDGANVRTKIEHTGAANFLSPWAALTFNL